MAALCSAASSATSIVSSARWASRPASSASAGAALALRGGGASAADIANALSAYRDTLRAQAIAAVKAPSESEVAKGLVRGAHAE